MANLNEYINQNLDGKCFRERDSESNIVQLVEFRPANKGINNRAGIRVWYPLTDTYGFIDSDTFENYVSCSATEIEKLRRQPKK